MTTTINRQQPHSPTASPEAAAQPAWEPPVDIREESERFVLRFDVPGVGPEGIDITLHEGILTVAGERPLPTSDDDRAFLRRERIAGRFSRTFEVSKAIDADSITATARQGVLELVLPKSGLAKRRQIDVEGA